MTVRDSRKFDEKFGDQKRGQQIWEICLLRDLPPNFSPKKIICAILRQAIEGSKFDEKFVKFPPHWPTRDRKVTRSGITLNSIPLAAPLSQKHDPLSSAVVIRRLRVG